MIGQSKRSQLRELKQRYDEHVMQQQKSKKEELDIVNEPTLHFDQLSPEAQARILAANELLEETPVKDGNDGHRSASRLQELKTDLAKQATEQRIKELERQLEMRAAQEVAHSVDEGLKDDLSDAEIEKLSKQYDEQVRQFNNDGLNDERKSLAACVPDCWASKDPEAEYGTEFPLSFEAYQAGAKKTAVYNQDARVLYPTLGLAGEVGEVIEKAGGISVGVDVLLNGMAVCAGKCANQVKKIIRDDDCECDTPRKHAIGKEIGGVLWYCAAVCSDLGLSLGDIAQENLDVLADRQERGTIKGDGDNR